MEHLLDRLFMSMCGIMLLMLLAMLFTLFVYAPVLLNAQAQCLEKGYPRSEVTWNLKKYCMNLEGTVTVRVDEIDT